MSTSKKLVPISKLRDSLSPEGRARADELVTLARPWLEFSKELRESLNLSSEDFAALVIEHGGSYNNLPLKALFDNVVSRGGKIEVNIRFD